MQQPRPRPVIRAQAPDEPATTPPSAAPLAPPVVLTLPPPEQLGITALLPTTTDWSAAHRRLDQLGVSCFQVDKQAGSCRVTCLMPSTQPGKNRRIEAKAATADDAVRLALEQAELLAQSGK